MVAIDATERQRPDGQSLASLVERARDELGAPLMADIDSLANGLEAARLGCQWVGTTLFGYTEATAAAAPPAWDLLGSLRAQLPARVGLICEGGIASSAAAAQALQMGADAVVVGTAITGVDLQVQRYAAFGAPYIRCNAQAAASLIEDAASPDAAGGRLLRDAAETR